MDFALAGVTIQQIIVFLNVAEYGGFARASDYLHMTQSAVSKSIAKLEKELGLVLFTRTTREIHLTDAGKILYQDWKKQTDAMHNSYIKAASLQREADTELKIGLLNTARPERYFWNFQERFKKTYPEIQLELSTEYMTDLEKGLQMGEYDAIMIPDFERYSLEGMGLSWKWAACNDARLVMSRSHPLAKRAALTMADILYENFIVLEHGEKPGIQGSYEQDLYERFRPYRVKPKLAAQYKNAYSIQYLFHNDNNVVLFTDDFFDFPDYADIVKIPVKDEKTGIICAWNDSNQKPSLHKFIEMLRPNVSGE